MTYLAYTIFSDAACTQVRKHVEFSGALADRYLQAFRNIKGSEPRERDIIAGCRIDRIGSYSEVAVDKAIAAFNRAGRRISGREAKAIHALLKGRH